MNLDAIHQAESLDHQDVRSQAAADFAKGSIVDGKEVGTVDLKRTVPAAFTATETFDIGAYLGSSASLVCFDRAPFPFESTCGRGQ